jgi:hypothetical protein
MASTSIFLSSSCGGKVSSSTISSEPEKGYPFKSFVPQLNVQTDYPFERSRVWALPKAEAAYHLIHSELSVAEQVKIFNRLFPEEKADKDVLEGHSLGSTPNCSGVKEEQAEENMTLRYSVPDRQLCIAIRSQEDSKVIQTMFDEAVLCEGFYVQESLHGLIVRNYPDELVFAFTAYATEVDDETLDSALSRSDISLKTIEALIDKMPAISTEIEQNVFARIFPQDRSGYFFFDEAMAEEEKKTGVRAITPAFQKTYFGHFENQPKPYIPYLTEASLSLVKKFFCKISVASVTLLDLLGQADEEMLKIFLKHHGKNILSFQFEHLLLYGCSEELILDISDHLEKKALDEDCLRIAVLRQYSKAVIEKIQTKCPPKYRLLGRDGLFLNDLI